MYHYIAHPGNGLDFRNVPNGIRETVCQRRESRCSRHIDSFPVRILPRHGILLPNITADDDHKRQAYGQPHRLDGGVEFIAGEEFQIAIHFYLYLCRNN